MEERKLIDEIMSRKTIALVGVSADEKKFGNMILKELKKKGYDIKPVHPELSEVAGEKCYPDLASLGGITDTVIISVKPKSVMAALKDAKDAGIDKVWIQQGAETPEIKDYCESIGISAVSGRCVIMFTEPCPFPHSMHKFFVKLFGRYPK